MNDQLKATARVIRDLLQHPETLMTFGRIGDDREFFEQDYIVLDSLAPAQPMSHGERYDGTAEVMTYSGRVRQPVTVDFFGLNAYTNASKLQLLLRSDKALDLQEQHGITVHGATQITDVKVLTGQQYGNRVQLELVIHYSPSINVDILRIDEAVIETTVN